MEMRRGDCLSPTLNHQGIITETVQTKESSMSESDRRTRWTPSRIAGVSVLLGLTLVALGAIALLPDSFGSLPSETNRLLISGTETFTITAIAYRPQERSHPASILSSNEAISLALSRVPEHATITHTVARLVDPATLSNLFFRDPELVHTLTSSQVWIVGVRAQGLIAHDIYNPPFDTSHSGIAEPIAGEPAEVVDGAFFVYEANGGSLIFEGVLSIGESPYGTPLPIAPTADPWRAPIEFWYSDIANLPNASESIVTATDLPFESDIYTPLPPTATSGP